MHVKINVKSTLKCGWRHFKVSSETICSWQQKAKLRSATQSSRKGKQWRGPRLHHVPNAKHKTKMAKLCKIFLEAKPSIHQMSSGMFLLELPLDRSTIIKGETKSDKDDSDRAVPPNQLPHPDFGSLSWRSLKSQKVPVIRNKGKP